MVLLTLVLRDVSWEEQEERAVFEDWETWACLLHEESLRYILWRYAAQVRAQWYHQQRYSLWLSGVNGWLA